MATTYYVMTDTGAIIDELCVSSFTPCESVALFKGFLNTLNPVERGVLGLVSEYSVEGAVEAGCYVPAPLTELEQIVVAKYNAHFKLDGGTEESPMTVVTEQVTKPRNCAAAPVFGQPFGVQTRK